MQISSKLWRRLVVAWLLFSVVFGAVVTASAVYEAFQWHRLIESFPG
jgi:hypothetical protein